MAAAQFYPQPPVAVDAENTEGRTAGGHTWKPELHQPAGGYRSHAAHLAISWADDVLLLLLLLLGMVRVAPPANQPLLLQVVHLLPTSVGLLSGGGRQRQQQRDMEENGGP